MTAPTSSWVLLGFSLLGGLLTVSALKLWRPRSMVSFVYFVGGLLTGELALFHIPLSLVVVAACASFGALDAAPGQVGVVIMILSWLGLLAVQKRAGATGDVLEQALAEGLGADYRQRLPAERRALIDEEVKVRDFARPFALRSKGVEWLKDIAYWEGQDRHERHMLDIYRPATSVSGAPVLLQIHGGAWAISKKDEQALPLIYYLVERGWIVVTNNYRLSPRARFPAHLVDCKRALAWVRTNIASYGGASSFIAVTGGSAGGHLAALMGLTGNDLRLQQGFEQVDTRVAACVPFYGVYDFTDRIGYYEGTEAFTDFLVKTVMPCRREENPQLWDLASPVALVRPDAPPFFILHGSHDSVAPVEYARDFSAKLRAVSRNPVVYAELPGAQHAWEVFRSARAMHSVHAVARFLEWCRINNHGG